MHWTSTCPVCGQNLRVCDEYDSERLRCPRCTAPVSVARPVPPSPPRWRWHLAATGTAVVLAVLSLTVLQAARKRPQPDRGSPGAMTRGRGMMAAIGEVPTPILVEPAKMRLTIPDRIDSNLFPLATRPPGLKPAGRIAPLLAMTGDSAEPTFTAGSDGLLRWFDSNFRELGKCQLAHPAYLLTLDRAKGRLYAASGDQGSFAVSSLGEREYVLGGLVVYDVRDILLGKQPSENQLRPLQTITQEAYIPALSLSRDGRWLSYITEVRSDVRLNRLDTTTFRTEQHTLPPGSNSRVAETDEGTLLILSGGRLHSVDPATGDVEELMEVGGSVVGIAPAGKGRVYLLEKRPDFYLMLVDLSRAEALARFAVSLPGRLWMRSGKNGRLHIGSSAVLDGQIQTFDPTDAERGWLLARGGASRNADRLLRGGWHLTPDSRHLVSSNGYIFTVPE